MGNTSDKVQIPVQNPKPFDSIKSSKENEKSNLAVPGYQDINILLLGETGVGKSTFINSIANYLHFQSFEYAMKAEELLFLVPTRITVNDVNLGATEITLGSDKNEHQEVGAAGTQNVKTYVFPIDEEKIRIRLIDSPGMGDPRGIEQDDTNCENILAYLSQLNELHAICFLMKPITTRRTVYFEYCVSQILSRLEKSASQNIIFVFTNTRGTDYTPGDTLPILRKVINEIKAQPPHVDIPLTKKNTFSLDNEAFKVLAALKKNLDIGEINDNFMKSWDNSFRECWRLLSYIVGDYTQPPLKPHQLQNTISINEARRLILQLSHPLVDISQLISNNLTVLDRHKHNLQLENQTLEEMKKKMYIPVVNLRVTQLRKPATVCTSRKCADVIKIGNLNRWHFRERCHDPCQLNNVTKELIGDPALLKCWAMNGTTKCRKCTCEYSVHMHVYYFTEPYDDKIVDDKVKNNIQYKEAGLNEVKRLIQIMEQRKKELEEEQHTVIKSTAQFAHFLQNNAISPFNDAYKGYIEYLITREKGLGRLSDKQMIANLERLLRQYEEIKRAFDKSLNLSKSLNGNEIAPSSITAQTVLNTIQALFQLKHNGKKIRELVDKQRVSRRSEYDGSCEYIHPKTCGLWKRQQEDVNNEKKGNEAFTNSAGNQLLSPSMNFPQDPPPPYSVECQCYTKCKDSQVFNQQQKITESVQTRSPNESHVSNLRSPEKTSNLKEEVTLDPAIEQLIKKTCNDLAAELESKFTQTMEKFTETVMSKIESLSLNSSSVDNQKNFSDVSSDSNSDSD